MSWLSRVANLFRSDSVDRELDEEIAFHVESRVQDLVAAGMTRESAEALARRQFGNQLRLREASRDVKLLPWLEDVARDVRYATRRLSRSPGFTAVTVLTLAIGLGANTAIFAAAYGYLFEVVPVRDPDTLVAFRWAGEHALMQMSSENSYIAGSAMSATGERKTGGTFPVGFFQQLQENEARTHGLLAVAALASAGSLSIVAHGRADPATGQFVSGRFFGLLGLSAERGRLVGPEDDRESAEPVVVLSRTYWIRRFAMDPGIVGKGITINGVPFTVAGIAPAGFRDLTARGLPDPPDVIIPLAREPRIRGDGAMLRTPAAWWLSVIARVASGVTTTQLEARLEGAIAHAIHAYVPPPQTPEQKARWRVPRLEVVRANHGLADPSPDVLTRFRILATIAAIVILLVCVNVANLLLSRSVRREREITVRKAIGASRARIVRQLFTEAALLAVLSGAIAPLVAFATLRALGAVLVEPATAAIEPPAVLFSSVLSMATAVLFGAIPAVRATRGPSGSDLREPAGSVSASRAHFGRSLVIVQVALSLPLLVAAGLFLRTLINLRTVDIGFDPENIVLFTLEPELNGYDRPRAAALYEHIARRLVSVPGVRSVTTSAFGGTLMDGGGAVMFLEGGVLAPMLSVDQNFFTTLDISLRRGRTFTAADTPASPPVAVVNETFVRRFFPNVDPIGRSFRAGRQMEIVGVVADARVNGLREPVPPTIYRTVAQLPLPSRRVVVRTDTGASHVIPAIRQAMREIDPNLPLQAVSTQVDAIEARYLASERMFASASTAVAGVALAVTMIGLFGLMSYTVARRTKELGIRVALGARRSEVLRSVIGEAVALAGIGTVIGLVMALAMGRFLETLIFGLSRYDPVSLSTAVVLTVVAAVAASYLPARRATSVDPLVALRSE
jgi:predicted permease